MSFKEPSYLDNSDREKYQDIIEKSFKRELTPKEKDFYTNMYHQEEFYCYGEL